MIVYDLECTSGCPRFEGWFKSSDDFEDQQLSGLLTCPLCGSPHVDKAVQAPRLGRKGNQLSAQATEVRMPQWNAPEPDARTPMAAGALPQEAVRLMQRLAEIQSEALRESRYVGDRFADQARAIHYGEQAVEAIHGEATPAEAEDLLEEGISVMPLPFPIGRTDKMN